MKNFWIRKGLNSLIFIATFIILEILMFAFMFGTAFSLYPHLDFIFILFFLIPVPFVKNYKFDIIYYSIIQFLMLVLTIANVNFYRVFGDIFSLQYLSLIGKGASVFSFSYIDFWHLSIALIVYGSSIAGLILLNKYFKEKVNEEKPFLWSKFVSSLSVFAISISSFSLLFSGAISVEREKFGDDSIAFDAVTMTKNTNFEQFGMLSYYIREINYLAFGYDDESIQNLNEYFKKEVDTDSGVFHGLLKDYNVVTIMIETGDDMMVNETLTPTLHKMLNKGINFTNNYSKNKTNVSELIGITGSSSTKGLSSKVEYKLPFSLPNLLNDTHSTMYFHDVGESNDIYNRDKVISRYGFENTYLHDEILGEDVPNWKWDGSYYLDSITMEKVSDMMLESEEPFYGFYTSLSMHGPYVDSANEELLESMYEEKLYDAKQKGLWVNPLGEDDLDTKSIENYMMACMDFDKGLQTMLDKFEQAGELDNTLFVLYGDHELYYNGAEGYQLVFKLNDKEDRKLDDYKMFKTVFNFYNEDLINKLKEVNGLGVDDSIVIDKFTSPYMIVPSILDLLGVDYNPNFYLGDSIFSKQFKETKHAFFSLELSAFFNDSYWTYDGNKIYKKYNDELTEKEFFNVIRAIMEKQARLDIIYSENIFEDYSYSSFNPA